MGQQGLHCGRSLDQARKIVAKLDGMIEEETRFKQNPRYKYEIPFVSGAHALLCMEGPGVSRTWAGKLRQGHAELMKSDPNWEKRTFCAVTQFHTSHGNDLAGPFPVNGLDITAVVLQRKLSDASMGRFSEAMNESIQEIAALFFNRRPSLGHFNSKFPGVPGGVIGHRNGKTIYSHGSAIGIAPSGP